MLSPDDRTEPEGDDRREELPWPLPGDGDGCTAGASISGAAAPHSLFTCMRVRSITLRTWLLKMQRMWIASKH